jgi:predicted amidohydrolase YtcJ
MQAHDSTHGRAPAEIIFTGGQVHTVNTRNDIFEAVAVGGGRILALGSTADIRPLAGPGTCEVPLRGRSLHPGFIDAHCHLTGLGVSMVSIDCKAPGMQSIEALQKAVYERAATQPPGAWIRGRGYDQTRLHERRHPNRHDWDAVAPDHPVIFTRTCGHIASVNSRALAAAGITDQTPDPPSGRYDRDGGRNLGVAYETAQTPLQMAALPTADEFGAALMQASAAYLAAGCTSVHDAGGLVGPAFGPCQDLVEAGRLKLRIYAFATVNSLSHPLIGVLGAGIRSRLGNEDERVDLSTAIRMHTINGALASFEEGFKGSLEVGKAADLVVLAEDLSGVPVEHLRHVGVVMTAVGDEVVYEV